MYTNKSHVPLNFIGKRANKNKRKHKERMKKGFKGLIHHRDIFRTNISTQMRKKNLFRQKKKEKKLNEYFVTRVLNDVLHK